MSEDYLLSKAESTVREFNMFSQGSKIVLGISGGPDSTVLLHIFWRLREKYNLNLWAVHLNHCIRLREAQEDEKWVKTITQKLEVPLIVDVIDVPALAREKKISLETAAREARYNFLEHFANKVRADRIAVGHTASDQVETILMRLIRGSGIDGLAGIPPVRGRVIRPLIRMFRWEIENYCRIHKLDSNNDSTNSNPQFLRNRIRIELMPYLRNNYNYQIVDALHRTANLLRIDKDFLSKLTEEAEKKVIKKKSSREIVVDASALVGLHLCLQRRITRSILETLKGDLEGIDYSHIEQILNLKEGEGTKLTCLPGGFKVWRQYNEFIFKKGRPKSFDFCVFLNVPGETEIPDLGLLFKANVLPELPDSFSCNSHQALFDLDKISEPLYIRPRKVGDKFVPLGMHERKKIKDFFIDLKVPRLERDMIPILLSGQKIMWIVDYRIDDRFKLSKDSKKILSIEVIAHVPRSRSEKKNT